METDERTEAHRTPGDARSMVEQMVAARQWPDPALMEQIIAAEEDAVEPLLEFLQIDPRGWPEEAPLCNAVGLLGEIRPPRAIPALVDVIRRYRTETAHEAGDALARFGSEGFDALMDLLRDPSIVGYRRLHLIDNARTAAAGDSGRNSRIAERLRQLFEEMVPRAREYRRGGPVADQPDGTDDFDDDELLMDAIPPEEELAHLAEKLSALADPLALDMIRAAFEGGLASTEILSLKDIEADYEVGGRPDQKPYGWMEEYRLQHSDALDSQRRLAEMKPFDFPSRSSYPDLTPLPTQPWPPPAPSAGPIRATAKIGRNDPCWCGSGKKYKKCHLGKDAPA
jgi:hypothetical protein